MTGFINPNFLLGCLLLVLAGCASAPDTTQQPASTEAEEQVVTQGIEAVDPQTANTTSELMADATGEVAPPVIHPFIANLPSDPYFDQHYPNLPQHYQQRLREAISLFQQGALEAAREIFTSLMDEEREVSSPYLHLAMISKQLDEKEKAIEFASKAVALNPYNYDAHNLLGIIAREDGRFADAEQHYLDILALWQGYDAAHLNLGILYDLYLGQFDKALEHYEKHLLLVDEDPRVTGWVADIKRRLNDA